MVVRRFGAWAARAVSVLLLLTILMGCGLAGRPAPTATPAEEPAMGAPGEEPTAAPPEAPTAAAGGTEPTAAPTPNTPPAAAGSVTAVTAAPTIQAAPATQAAPPAAPVTTLPPSNGPLANKRLVTYYGHPYSSRMGILGEFDDPQQMIARLKKQAADYTAADPSRPAIPTIELIASVAQDVPGSDGLYLIQTPNKVIEQYAQLAEQNGCLLLLDIQIGLDTVPNEIRGLLPFLKRPYVHLAIDPEFHVKPGQVPGDDYGSVSAAEVNGAAQILADLVTQNTLPDKVLVLHQFRHDMLPDKEQIRPIAHVQMVVVMDGWGTPESKIGNYGAFVRDEPIQYGGLKLFYRQDAPLLAPEDVLKLDPNPLVIIYQ